MDRYQVGLLLAIFLAGIAFQPVYVRSLTVNVEVDFQINFVREIESTSIIQDGFFPNGITLTEDNIYLSTVNDNMTGAILVLDFNFNLTLKIDEINGSNFFPLGLDVYEDRLYFVDSLLNEIVVYDLNGDFKFKFGGTGNTNGLFNTLNDVAVNSKFIYAADFGETRVQIFDHQGLWKKESDTFVSQNRHVTATETHLYSTSWTRQPIIKYDIDGIRLTDWGNAEQNFGPPRIGYGEFNLDSPSGLGVAGPFVVAGDWRSGRLQLFDHIGTYLGDFLGLDNEIYQFDRLIDLDTNSTHIFAVDVNRGTIVLFEIEELRSSSVITLDGTANETSRPTYKIYTRRTSGQIPLSINWVIIALIVVQKISLQFRRKMLFETNP